MSDPYPSPAPHRSVRHEDKRGFLQKLAEFIHPGPDSKDELIETLADAEDNNIINAESRVMLEGVIRMADMTAGDVMVPPPRMDLLSIDADYLMPLEFPEVVEAHTAKTDGIAATTQASVSSHSVAAASNR